MSDSGARPTKREMEEAQARIAELEEQYASDQQAIRQLQQRLSDTLLDLNAHREVARMRLALERMQSQMLLSPGYKPEVEEG